MPEPLIRSTFPGRPGLALTLAPAGFFGVAYHVIELLVDGIAARRGFCSNEFQGWHDFQDVAERLARGCPVEALPLAEIPNVEPLVRVRPLAGARVVQVPLAAAEYFHSLPYDGDNDPDGGVWQ